MKQILVALLLVWLPLAAVADGKVIPSVAFPAQVTIPDQRALIHFTNGVERLVIETRFTGAGTNFAWVVPLPSQPVIEAATSGLFPTLEYLFRPEIVHEVPKYYVGILLALFFLYLIWRGSQSVWNTFLIAIFILILATLFLPALAASKKKAQQLSDTGSTVAILDRKLVGSFETTTISSPEPKALKNWLDDNGFSLPTNAAPVIASYVKDGWVFVATKVRRDQPGHETSTPHPLSFTFKTAKPVYPMRLTGVDNGNLSVDLYVFGDSQANAPHFTMASCGRKQLAHPLLHQWFGDAAIVTKLTAKLSPADMRQDVRLNLSPFIREKENRLFSQQGALTIALNWGMGAFAVGLLGVWLMAFVRRIQGFKLLRLIGQVILVSIVLGGVIYLFLPKVEVRLVKGRDYYRTKIVPEALHMEFADGDWHAITEARAGMQSLLSNPTNAAIYSLDNWDNNLVGGQVREEDSPGNYLLRETNSQLQLITFDADGAEKMQCETDLRPSR